MQRHFTLNRWSSRVGHDTYFTWGLYLLIIGFVVIFAKGAADFNDKFLDKALEYQALRTTPGYFQGAMWNDKIDKWGGRKHTLMQDFEDIFAKNKYPVTMLIGLLGEPDEFVTLSHELFNVIQSVPQFSRQEEYKSGNFLVYYWRGRRDFLFFEIHDESVVNAHWYYAGE